MICIVGYWKLAGRHWRQRSPTSFRKTHWSYQSEWDEYWSGCRYHVCYIKSSFTKQLASLSKKKKNVVFLSASSSAWCQFPQHTMRRCTSKILGCHSETLFMGDGKTQDTGTRPHLYITVATTVHGLHYSNYSNQNVKQGVLSCSSSYIYWFTVLVATRSILMYFAVMRKCITRNTLIRCAPTLSLSQKRGHCSSDPATNSVVGVLW